MDLENELLKNKEKLHTTQLGIQRIKKNLSFDTNDIVNWCKEKICLPDTVITKRGKNWYAETNDCIITINSHSYTIITAHKIKI